MSSKQEELLEEMTKWLRLIGMQEAKGVISQEFDYGEEEKERAAKIAYQLTNGENTTRDIADYIPYSYRWVSYRHQEWAAAGLIQKEDPQSPYEHIISLETLGIDHPDLEKVDENSED